MNLLLFTNLHPGEKSVIEINYVEQSEAKINFTSFISNLLVGSCHDFFPRDLNTLLLIAGAAWGTMSAMNESSWE